MSLMVWVVFFVLYLSVLALDLAVVSPRGVVSRADVDFTTNFLIPGRSINSISWSMISGLAGSIGIKGAGPGDG